MPFADVEARRAYQRAYYRVRLRLRYRRYRRAGACGSCGLPIESYARCLRCRVRLADLKRVRRHSERAQKTRTA
jgi:succinate dehydrogenase/fumarate reductase-like Fe-S protein